MTPQDVQKFIQANDVKVVDLKFNDMPGLWQHFSMPVSELTEMDDLTKSIWVEGIGFDGSSIRGFQKIQESDMILIPDPNTARLDPICAVPTVSIICDIYDPLTRQPYSRDPRYVAKKAEAYLQGTGIADVSYWGPECEFFIFDDIRFDQTENSGFYYIDSVEGEWNSGKDEKPNLGYKPRYKEGYFPVPPTDTLQDFRSEAILRMLEAGIEIEAHHHEVATAGQCEIDIRFNSLTRMADHLMLYKYILKNVAREHGKTVTFMPKPLFQDNGSGMHVHQSLWQDGSNLFYDAAGYAQLSETALYYIGGLLKHSAALLALCAPTTNSYRRLVPGYEAPVNLAYSQRNRSAAVRIPLYSTDPRTKRLEYRPPDASCNPYLAFAALLMAGLDGVINRIDPGEAVDFDIYEASAEETARIKQVPGSLAESLDALEMDYEFLLRGDVFTMDLIETWIAYKHQREVDPIRLRPHPYEFFLYYDV